MALTTIATGGKQPWELELERLMAQRRAIMGRGWGGGEQYGQLLDLDRQIRALQARGGDMAAPAEAAAGRAGFRGDPQFYGFGDFEEFEESLFEQQMAGVETRLAPGGGLTSSLYGTAAVQARAEAQRTRMGLERQEKARRTGWEQTEAMRQWRERETAASRRQSWYMQTRQLEARRREQQQQWWQFIGQMSQQDWWNMMSAIGGAASEPPPEQWW